MSYHDHNDNNHGFDWIMMILLVLVMLGLMVTQYLLFINTLNMIRLMGPRIP